jgi:small-conductance mechanosensitive channel
MTGKKLLDEAAAAAVQSMTSALERFFGSKVNEPMLGLITAADILVFSCLLLLVLIVNGVAAAWLASRIRRAETRPELTGWRSQIFRSIGRPFYLLIWIYGIYLAATPLLMRLPATREETPHAVRLLFDKFFDFGVFVVLLWAVYRFTRVIEARLQALASRTEGKLDDLLAPMVGRSLRVIIPVVGVIFSLPAIGLSSESSEMLAKASSILIILTVAWVLVQAVNLGEKAVLLKYDIKAADNLAARKVYTQVHVLAKAAYVIVAVFTAASILMLFEEVRQFGTSLLASAGVIGIVVGFAAQRTIANLFAGFQVAMTQPIRLDDVVIVEGEWGRIEEITLTYVVVNIWDERRLIVPLSYFIEKPFQNWTRNSANILGSVFVWADYTLPVDELRPVVERIVAGCKDWDKRFWNLQVTDTNERAMQLRVLATACDASKAWNLRCEIREKLLGYLQSRKGENLPKIRALLEGNLSQEPRPGAN